MDVAHTILNQIKAGDKWCLPACGARDFRSYPKGLTFKVTIKPGKSYHVSVLLVNDLYNVELTSARGAVVKTEANCNGVGADKLAAVIYGMCQL